MVVRRLGPLATAFYQARGATWTDELPLIGLPDTPGNAHYNEYIQKQVPKGRIVARANTEGRITDLVRRGIGIGYVDCFIGEPEAGLERLPGFGLTEDTLYAVMHVEMRRSPRVRAVLDFLADLIAGAQMQPSAQPSK
jgi:DNA-binding transcriptional LysR family regulator